MSTPQKDNTERHGPLQALPEDVRHSIAEIVNYNYPSEEADYCQCIPGDGSVYANGQDGHIFLHLERVNAWLIANARDYA